jgi:transposase
VRFGLSDVVMVGDRGMITSARIAALKEVGGLGWLTALRAPAIAALAASGALQMSLFDEVGFAEITHPDYEGERLVACRNPALGAERAKKREALLAATEADLAEVKAAVEREHRPLRGKDKIALRVGRVLNKHKVAKHFELTIGDDSFSFSRKDDQVSAEAALDGIYVVRASAPHTEGLSATELVGAYKDLKFNEAGFYSLKAIDLDLRPIYHYSEGRVRAHVLICMLALYLLWHLRRAWAPLSSPTRRRYLVPIPSPRRCAHPRPSPRSRANDASTASPSTALPPCSTSWPASPATRSSSLAGPRSPSSPPQPPSNAVPSS